MRPKSLLGGRAGAQDSGVGLPLRGDISSARTRNHGRAKIHPQPARNGGRYGRPRAPATHAQAGAAWVKQARRQRCGHKVNLTAAPVLILRQMLPTIDWKMQILLLLEIVLVENRKLCMLFCMRLISWSAA